MTNLHINLKKAVEFKFMRSSTAISEFNEKYSCINGCTRIFSLKSYITASNHLNSNSTAFFRINQTAPNQLLSRRKAAEYLGVKENTLAIWACNKRYSLPVIKVGRLCKYRLSDLLPLS
jgi:hypothetical protein